MSMPIAERFVEKFKQGLQRYPDEVFIFLIITDIKSHFYRRSLKKYLPIGETVSFLSGYTIPQNIISRLFIDSPVSGVAWFPSVAPAYMLGRAIDDMSDGDLDPKVFGYDNFPAYIRTAKRQIRNGCSEVEKGYTLDFLLKYTLEKLEKEQKPTDNVRQDWDMFLDAMMVEYDRRINHKVLTKNELKTLDDNSFSYAHNIMLISLHSNTRFKDIEEIGQLQGKIFALRDLKPELVLSICNIPQEILGKAHLDLIALIENPNLIDNNEEILRWMKEELDLGKNLFDELKQKIPKLDFIAKIYLNFLMKGVELGMKKVEKEWFFK